MENIGEPEPNSSRRDSSRKYRLDSWDGMASRVLLGLRQKSLYGQCVWDLHVLFLADSEKRHTVSETKPTSIVIE